MGKEEQAEMKLREIFKGRFPVVCFKINKQVIRMFHTGRVLVTVLINCTRVT